MICNVCQGTGFKNIHQIPEDEINHDDLIYSVTQWIAKQTLDHDVCVCDCCGDGECWYGEPGQHYGSNDPVGSNGPYASNGGLCKCH